MFGKIVIVVCQRGWIYVGRLVVCQDNQLFYTLKNSATVRQWGTTKGLEQLATYGPTEKTILDKSTTDRPIAIFAIINMLICDETAWEGKL